MTKPLEIISLGAGVQSSTMALMAKHGDLPKPDAAIFADTGWEPRKVYKHLNWLIDQLPFPVYRVQRGNIRQEQIDGGSDSTQGRFAGIPWFIRNLDGSKGMGKRQCTTHYKVEVIQKKIVHLCHGERKPGQARMWIGISIDEATRMKPSRVKYIVNRWPLIELKMSRLDCLNWLKHHGYPEPPKSACIGCPFHSDRMWRDMKRNDPVSWADAVEADKLIRRATWNRGMRGEQYMHSSLKPLDEVDLSTEEDHGQLNMFENECEGMCGV